MDHLFEDVFLCVLLDMVIFHTMLVYQTGEWQLGFQVDGKKSQTLFSRQVIFSRQKEGSDGEVSRKSRKDILPFSSKDRIWEDFIWKPKTRGIWILYRYVDWGDWS